MLIFPYYAFILLGLALAVFFFVLFRKTKQAVQLICALLWLLPITYEWWVLRNCTGECNIRVDLLYVWPLELLVLIGLSGLCWYLFRRHKQRQ